MDKHHQIKIFDPQVDTSNQASYLTKQLQKIGKCIDWEPLYHIGSLIGKNDLKGELVNKPRGLMIQFFFAHYLLQLKFCMF